MQKTRLSYNLDLKKESLWLSVTAAQSVRASIAYVQELGDFRCGSAYFTHREKLASYLIKLCTGGKGILEYEGKRYIIKPGQLFWIDCMKPQMYQTDGNVGFWDLRWVHMYGPPCAAYYDLFMSMNDNSPVVDMRTDTQVREFLDILLKMYEQGSGTLQDDIEASGLLTQMMTRCISYAGADDAQRRFPRYVLETQKYIDQHYDRQITLDTLSHEISINKFYLQKLFKRHVGMSPNEYLIYTRLNHAKRLLRTTDEPISRVAPEVGMGNIGHFIEIFKKYENITPSLYRRNWYRSDMEENDGDI